MRLVADRDVLLRTLKRVSGAVVRSSKIPITTNVLIRVEDAKARLTGTDLDMTITASMALSVGEDGDTTVPAYLLLDILNSLPAGGEVEIKHGRRDDHALLTCGRSRCRLPALAAKDFPLVDPGKPHGGGDIIAPDLARLIDKTRFAISQDASRYAICGLYFDVVAADGEACLRASAADKNRLARCTAPVDASFVGFPGVAPPARAVDEIRRLIEGAEIVSLHASPGWLSVEAADTVLVTKVIDNPFREHDRMLGWEPDAFADLDVNALRRSLRLALSAADAKGEPLVALDLSKGCAAVSAGGMFGQQAVEEIETDFDGEPLTLGLNGKTVSVALDCVDADRVRLAFVKPKPGAAVERLLLIDPDNPEVVSLATTARVNSFASQPVAVAA